MKQLNFSASKAVEGMKTRPKDGTANMKCGSTSPRLHKSAFQCKALLGDYLKNGS